MTKIEWANKVWNPITGCSYTCQWCYARRFANRLQHNPNVKVNHKYRNGFEPSFHPEALCEPSKWEKPARVFVCSMGELFDPAFMPNRISDLDRIFNVMEVHNMHTYILLTKQPALMLGYIESRYGNKGVPGNIWIGVSVSNSIDFIRRVPILYNINASVRIISAEPLTGHIDLGIYADRIQWVICGGMSGHKAIPMHTSWVKSLLNQCISANIPFFFKRWGAHIPNDCKSRELDGVEYNEIPTIKKKAMPWESNVINSGKELSEVIK